MPSRQRACCALCTDEVDALFKWVLAACEPHSFSLPRVLRSVKNGSAIFGRVNEEGQSEGVCCRVRRSVAVVLWC